MAARPFEAKLELATNLMIPALASNPWKKQPKHLLLRANLDFAILLAVRTDQASRPRKPKPTHTHPSRGLRFTDTTCTRQNPSGAKISAAEADHQGSLAPMASHAAGSNFSAPKLPGLRRGDRRLHGRYCNPPNNLDAVPV